MRDHLWTRRDQVLRITLIDGGAEFGEAFDVGVGEKAAIVWGKAEHELAAATDTFFVDAS